MYWTKENYSEYNKQLNIPKPKLTFWDNQITYNQKTNGYKMWCIFHAWLWCISDITWKIFSYNDIVEVASLCAKKWRTASEWMYINDWATCIINYCKSKKIDIENMFIEIWSPKMYEVLEMWYSVHTGFRGNNEYNKDKNDDCIVQWVKFWSTTYGHSIRLVQDWNIIKVVDNYGGTKCNVYTLLNFKKLLESGMFFKWWYIYILKDKQMPTPSKPIKIMPDHNVWKKPTEKEIVLEWERVCDPTKLRFKNYIDEFYITKMIIDIDRQRND